MKAYWNCEAEELKKNFQVSEEGLLPAQVEAIRREKGENVLQEGKRKSVAAVFAQQFCDLLVVILIIAAVILVCGLGFSGGLTFHVGEADITLTSLALAAIFGILLNAILPGNDYEFGNDIRGDVSRGLGQNPQNSELK